MCFSDECKVELKEVDLEPKANGILIKNLYTMISPGTELALYSGLYRKTSSGSASKTWRTYPFFPGYSAVGRVVESTCSDFKAGDLVFHPSKHGSYEWFDADTGLAVNINNFQKPEYALFARFAQIASTALRTADFQSGEYVLVTGLGIIGNMAAQLFKLSGARVFGSDIDSNRRQMAEHCGIPTLNPMDPDYKENLLKITKGQGMQVVVEATGNPAVVNQSLEAACECGQVILLGSPRGMVQLNLYSYVHVKGITILGAHERMQRMNTKNRGGKWDRIANTNFVIEAIKDGRLVVSPLITDIIKPIEAANMYKTLLEGNKHSLGIVVDWQDF